MANFTLKPYKNERTIFILEIMANDYIDRTLIKLKRKYGKDELVATLIKQIKEDNIKIGQLSSEIDYLRNELEVKKYNLEINKVARIEIRKDELFALKVKECKDLRERLKKLKAQRDELLQKSFKV